MASHYAYAKRIDHIYPLRTTVLARPPKYTQWIFQVPVKGGRYYVITQLAVYTTYIPLIVLAFWEVMKSLPPFTGTRKNQPQDGRPAFWDSGTAPDFPRVKINKYIQKIWEPKVLPPKLPWYRRRK